MFNLCVSYVGVSNDSRVFHFTNAHFAKRVAGTVFSSPLVKTVLVIDTDTCKCYLSLIKDENGKCVRRFERDSDTMKIVSNNYTFGELIPGLVGD